MTTAAVVRISQLATPRKVRVERGERPSPSRGAADANQESVWRRTVLAAMILVPVLAACATSDDPSVIDTVIVTWPNENGSTNGQVIVAIRNDTDRTIDPDVFGRGRQTLAQLLDADGNDLPGSEMRIQLNAVPDILGAGESGYLFADFNVAAADVADARIELNADRGETPTPVIVEGFERSRSTTMAGRSGTSPHRRSATTPAISRCAASLRPSRPTTSTTSPSSACAPVRTDR